jgi:5-hydroxyisourate hydrolase-like protein (transthyretin family)
VNAALAAVSFAPATDNDVDATITTHIQDQDATGPADGLITLDVTPVNDAPTATNLTQTQTYTEGDASVALDDIVVSEVDTDPAQTITATLTLSNTAAGMLTTSGAAAYDAGTGVWTITDTVANVNAALAAVSFTPATDNDVDATIATHIQDQDATGPADGLITLDVTPVNDAPTASNLTQTQTYTEGDASVALDDIVVSEVDTDPAQTITATLTLNNTAAGALTTSGTATYTAGTGVWTVTGTVAQVNAALAAVSFTPATDNDVDTTITTHIQDQSGTGPANGTITLDVTPVNDAPTATNLTQSLMLAEDAVPPKLFTIAPVVSDIDSANVTATLTLADPAAR